MKILILFLAVCSLAVGSPLPEADPSPAAYASDYGYYLPAISPPSSQYHAQDELGQYNYGYSSADQTKSEVKTADGVVRGAYSYVDANGIVQTVNYISDALGFRVAATNLPIHVVDQTAAGEPAVAVQAAIPNPVEAAAPAAVESPAVAAADSSVLTAQVPYTYLPYALNYGYQMPAAQYTPAVAPQPIFSLPYAAAQPTTYVQAAVPAVPIAATAAPIAVAPIATASLSSQYHSQDLAGQYTFGYADGSSDRQEIKTVDGVVRGAYHYVDSNGLIQTVEYIADSAGFRVAGTNLPIHLDAAPVDTPEVAAAKAQHALLYSQAAAQAALQPEGDEGEEEEDSAVVEEGEPTAYYGAAVQQSLPAVTSAVVPSAYYGAAVSAYAAAPLAVVPQVAVVPQPIVVASSAEPTGSQFHAQDELGQYNYGYSNANSEKQEVKTADGVVRGSYRYVDSDGQIQTVNYIADALGFRVGATNLPVHVIPADNAAVPAVAQAAVPAVEAVNVDQPVVAAYSAPSVLAPQVSYAYLPYASGYGYSSPLLPYVASTAVAQPVAAAEVAQPVAAPVVQPVEAIAPAVAPVIVAGTTTDQNSQFHAQDELGQYNYGYANPTQTKTEVKTADGIVRGSYSYVDANGLIQTVNYISDAMGFRVAATNLPVHIVDQAVAGESAGTAVEEAKLRAAAEAPVITPQVAYSYLPYAQSYAYSMPTAIAA